MPLWGTEGGQHASEGQRGWHAALGGVKGLGEKGLGGGSPAWAQCRRITDGGAEMGWQAGRLGEGLEADGRRMGEGMATWVRRRGRREGDGVVEDDAPPGDGQRGGVLS